LQTEYWSRNTDSQNESLSAEFQQGKKPSEDQKMVSIHFGLAVVLLG
jgi:hypothetical protein